MLRNNILKVIQHTTYSDYECKDYCYKFIPKLENYPCIRILTI